MKLLELVNLYKQKKRLERHNQILDDILPIKLVWINLTNRSSLVQKVVCDHFS